MEGYGLTTADSFQVVSAYASARTQIPGFTASPGWNVVGAFFMPLDGTARIDALGSVSASGLTLRVRLFDLTTLTIVPGEVTITSQIVTRALGPKSDLTGQHLYQIQAECVGGAGSSNFATIETVTVSE